MDDVLFYGLRGDYGSPRVLSDSDNSAGWHPETAASTPTPARDSNNPSPLGPWTDASVPEALSNFLGAFIGYLDDCFDCVTNGSRNTPRTTADPEGRIDVIVDDASYMKGSDDEGPAPKSGVRTSRLDEIAGRNLRQRGKPAPGSAWDDIHNSPDVESTPCGLPGVSPSALTEELTGAAPAARPSRSGRKGHSVTRSGGSFSPIRTAHPNTSGNSGGDKQTVISDLSVHTTGFEVEGDETSAVASDAAETIRSYSVLPVRSGVSPVVVVGPVLSYHDDRAVDKESSPQPDSRDTSATVCTGSDLDCGESAPSEDTQDVHESAIIARNNSSRATDCTTAGTGEHAAACIGSSNSLPDDWVLADGSNGARVGQTTNPEGDAQDEDGFVMLY